MKVPWNCHESSMTLPWIWHGFYWKDVLDCLGAMKVKWIGSKDWSSWAPYLFTNCLDELDLSLSTCRSGTGAPCQDERSGCTVWQASAFRRWPSFRPWGFLILHHSDSDSKMWGKCSKYFPRNDHISLPRGHFCENEFPFPKLRYVSSLEDSHFWMWNH